MLEICENIIQIYREYVGEGMMFALFAAAVFYLIYGEKERSRKLILAVTSVVLFALFACPLFAWLISLTLDEEIYYRFLWLLPVTIVIAYAGCKLILRMQGVKRLLALAAVCGIIGVCGDYVYDNTYFTGAENAYHVPKTVIEICDEIVVEGREVKAVFPTQMLQYVRQYTPYVCMPYGREMLVERWFLFNDVYDVYERGLPDGVVEAKRLAKVARENGVHYIIWDMSRSMEGDLTDYRFTEKKEVDGYMIYVDEDAYLGL